MKRRLGVLFLICLASVAIACSSQESLAADDEPTTTASSSSEVPYSSADDPYGEAVAVLLRARIVAGYEDGSFGSADSIIRQQFAKMIVLALALPVSETDVCPFDDVPQGPPGDLYPDHYVAVCADYGITRGTSPTKFSPTREISRAQVITMIVRAVDSLRPGLLASPPRGYTSTWGVFDATHSANAATAEYNGLLRKLPLGTLNPLGSATRGEVAQILANLMVSNVEDYGALGNGQTDDTLAIQTAIDAAGSRPRGVVFVPAGTYPVTELNISDSGLVVLGEGVDTVVTSESPGRQEIIAIEGDSDLSGVEIRDLTIVGRYSRETQIGIGIYGLSNGRLENLTIRDVGYSGIVAWPASDLTVNECTITHCGDFGVHTKTGSMRVSVTNNVLSGFASRLYPGHGIYFSNTNDAVATGNHVSEVRETPTTFEVSGIKVTGGSGAFISGNTIEDSLAGISLPKAQDVIVDNNIIRRVTERGIYLLSGTAFCSISNNLIEESPRGIEFGGYGGWPHDIQLVDNTALNCQVPLELNDGRIVNLTQEGNSWQTGERK